MKRLTYLCFVSSLLVGIASADTMGFISWDVTSPGSAGEFDIFNGTGPNSSGDATFPVSTLVSFSSLSLTVHFSDGSTVTEPSTYFTLSSDGESFDGSPIGIGGLNPLPTEATLTGTFSPTTITLFDGTTETIDSGFSTTIFPSSGSTLADGDLAIIASTPAGTSPVPEPSSWILLGTMAAGLGLSRKQHLRALLRKLPAFTRTGALPLIVLMACSLLIPGAQAAVVKLASTTSPSSGVAGANNVNITVTTGWPAGDTTPANVMVTWATSCGGAAVAVDAANSLKTIIGTSERVNVNVPGALATGTYYVQVNDSAAGDTPVTSSNCSAVQVTHTSAVLGSCVPASSLGVVSPVTGPNPVKAYVPNGAWASNHQNLEVVQVETGGGPTVSPVTITTGADVINSCAGNPATGDAVCTANNNRVYHIRPDNSFTLLSSGATVATSFSGGSCFNCGVAVNALNDQAVITVGLSGSPSASGLQVLNLGSDTFATPFATRNQVSENISIDPTRGLVLSANEVNVYDLVSFDSGGNLTTEFAQHIPFSGEMDSSTEDCVTGIAMSVGEFTNDVVLADLTQAVFTPGTPGSWTAPHSVTGIIGSYSAGLSGSAVAPGPDHVAVVTGEFGGSSFAILKLPSTSGSGTPAIVDYAYVSCVIGMSAGLDPHTVTAYTSPNDGKPYSLFANSATFPPNLLRADMNGILSLPRQADGHTVIGDSGNCLDPAGSTGSTVLQNIASH